MEPKKFLRGHQPVGKRLNIRKEIRRLRQNPVEPFLILVDRKSIYSDEVNRFRDAYSFYHLSLERFLPEMAIACKWHRTVYWSRRYRRKYSESEVRTAKQYNEIYRFLEYDIGNCLLHARILLDRLIALSHLFLNGGNTPSFDSFNEHKKFFIKRAGKPYGEHEPYAEYIRTNTDWFADPLQEVRDKFFVHSSPKHMRFLAHPNDYEIDLIVNVKNDKPPRPPFTNYDTIIVNVPRLSSDIEDLLKWFCDYGVSALKSKA
jgi:hypothetical protein